MSRQLILREQFLESLIEIEAYLSTYSAATKARKFSTDAIGFLVEVIVENPFAFVKYESRFPENENVRRAVFKKDYCIVYEVFDDRIDVLNIYHNSRNPDKILF